MITFKHEGNFDKTTKFLTGAKKIDFKNILESYGRQGVEALSSATPVDTGLTSKSWDYSVYVSKNYYSISWTNSNTVNGIPIVILLQYGHGTRNGGYVQGKDFINPAIQPIMNDIAENVWKEVIKL